MSYRQVSYWWREINRRLNRVSWSWSRRGVLACANVASSTSVSRVRSKIGVTRPALAELQPLPYGSALQARKQVILVGLRACNWRAVRVFKTRRGILLVGNVRPRASYFSRREVSLTVQRECPLELASKVSLQTTHGHFCGSQRRVALYQIKPWKIL